MNEKSFSVDKAMSRAKSHAKRGEVEQARSLYRAVLERFPNNKRAIEGLDALSLGVGFPGAGKPSGGPVSQGDLNAAISLYSQGDLQEALIKTRNLIATHAKSPVLFNLLGAIYTDMQQLDAAIASYQNALKIKPDYAEVHNNLGNVFKDQGRFDQAVTSYRKALQFQPDMAEIHNNLGNALRDQGRYEEAIASYRRALQLQPNLAETYNNLGNALKNHGKSEEAIASYRRALEINPDYGEAHTNLGMIFMDMGRFQDAEESYHRALQITPGSAEAYYNYANALRAQGKLKEAIASYHRALEINPEAADIYNNLGVSYMDQGDWEESAKYYQYALRLNPGIAGIYNNLGIVLGYQKKYSESIFNFRKAIEIDPEYISAKTSLMFQLSYICEWDSEKSNFNKDIFNNNIKPDNITFPFDMLSFTDDGKFHRKISELNIELKYKRNISKINKYPSRDRIKIGYYSNDFYNHALMYLLAEMFELHDKSRFEVHVFSFGANKGDEMRQRLIDAVENFHDVYLLPDGEIVERSRQIGIDIAVDLKGFTQNLRLDIFALQAAPIQVSYMGYPGTMGADFIDYIIADPILIPESHREYYSEKVAYLPDSYQVNDRKRAISNAPMKRSDYGLPEKGFVFCCFNNNYKITPKEYDIWMRLLQAVEGSVLWLFQDNEIARDNLRKEAQKRGVAPERILFAERAKPDMHLARHRLADLFLDTFNYNAHTTASDALWAGLPLITCMGNSFASRVAGSVLTAVGLPELITNSHADYEALALELATNPAKLAAIRQKLHDTIPTAPLFDSVRFTKNIEKAYEIMYRKYHDDEAPDHFYV